MDGDRPRRVLTELRAFLAEFAHKVPAGHQLPQVTLRPAGDPGYFPAGVKHRYTRGRNDRS